MSEIILDNLSASVEHDLVVVSHPVPFDVVTDTTDDLLDIAKASAAINDLRVDHSKPSLVHQATSFFGFDMTSCAPTPEMVAAQTEKQLIDRAMNDMIRDLAPPTIGIKYVYRGLKAANRECIMGDYLGGERPNLRDLKPQTLADVKIIYDIFKVAYHMPAYRALMLDIEKSKAN